VSINNDKLADKVIWFLEYFENDVLEIVARKDSDDLKLLRATRHEESITFDKYLESES